MAYTTDLKSVARKGLRVQVPPLAPVIAAFVQRTGHGSSKARMVVRFLHAAPVMCM